MDKLSELKRQYERLGAEIEKLEQQPKPWPQAGDEYWCAGQTGHVRKSIWYGDSVDHYRLATGDCHRTESEALAYREYQKDPRVVARGMIERMINCHGRYYLSWSFGVRELHVGETDDYFGEISSCSCADLTTIIREHTDLCKVALGVITGEEEAGRIVREAISRG